MKKFISLLAAMALSLASVTAFAAPAATDNIHVKLVADKSTIAPGESVVISAFISANGTDDVVLDTVASIGVVYDTENFTYEVTKSGDFMMDDFGVIWGMDDAGMSYTPNTSCIEITFTANDNAAEATYSFDVSDDPADTAFCNGYDVWDSEVGNVVLTGTSVEVKEAGPQGPVATKGETAANGITEYTVANDDDLAGKKVMMSQTFTQQAITEATRFVVTWNGDKKIFGSDLYAKLGGQEGEITIGSLTFGLIVNDANAKASDFTFEIK